MARPIWLERRPRKQPHKERFQMLKLFLTLSCLALTAATYAATASAGRLAWLSSAQAGV